MTPPATAAPEEPARVLLVDDEPSNLDILRQALDGRSYRLLVARSGVAGESAGPRGGRPRRRTERRALARPDRLSDTNGGNP